MRELFIRGVLAFVALASSVNLQAAVSDVFPKEQCSEAKNTATMYLFPEEGKLIGKVTEIVPEQEVVIEVDKKQTSLKPSEDGAFHWVMDDSKEAKTISISYGEIKKVVTVPAMQKNSPVAFFVIDRSVCRVNTSFHFVAFLREENAGGKYMPYATKPVEVEIRSRAKGIVVAKLKLTPDAHGKIVGKYDFTAADPLDDYDVTCLGGIAGKASVKLAEFRKAKVRLDVSGKRENDQFKLHFKTLDFLGKPVPASSLRFSAKVYRKSAPMLNLWGLNPKEFHGYIKEDSLWYVMDAEQRALLEAGNPHVQTLLKNAVLHEFSKVLKVGQDGEVSHTLTLDPLWKNDCLIEITATVIDSNNREQHAVKTIPLSSEGEADFDFQIEHSEIIAGKEIKLIATQKEDAEKAIQGMSFVVFELQTVSKAQTNVQDIPNVFINNGLHRHQIIFPQNFNLDLRSGRRSQYYQPYTSFIPAYQLQRQFIAMQVGKQTNKGSWESKLSLTRPGAYVIRAVAVDANGVQQETEQTIVVKTQESAKAIYLTIGQQQLDTGKALSGIIHSSFTNAKVLLVVRDGHGVQAMKTISLTGNQSPFTIKLPSSISLGCSVTAMYSDDAQTLHQVRRRFQVRPDTQPIKVTSKLPELPAPGETVELSFEVDRKAEVDLVVSVYDKSLLGVAAHKAIDGRSLFFADTRVEQQLAQKMVDQYLSGLTKNNIVKALETIKSESPEQVQILHHIKNTLNAGRIDAVTLRKILAWRGAPISTAMINSRSYYNYWSIQMQSDDYDLPLSELIKRSYNGNTSLSFILRGGQLGMVIKQNRNNVDRILFHELDQSKDFYRQNYFGRSSGAGAGSFGVPVTRRNRSIRGDGSFSATANSSISNLSGQAMISHLPANQAGGQNGGAAGAIPVRVNFSDSAFFTGNLRTDANGKASVKFKLPDSLTNWHVVVTAVSKNLSIGQHSSTFKTYKPVMVWPMLPQSFTSEDRVKVFAKVHNLTDEEQEFTVSAEVKNGVIHGDKVRKITLPAQSNKSIYFDYEAGKAGFTEILMTVDSAAGKDASLKRLPVYPCAAEQVLTRSGFVKGIVDMTLPEGIDREQSQIEITIAPSIAGDMLDSLDYLIDYPHGCVEQTMSRFLPVVKVAQILRENDIDDPALAKKVPRYAEAGIKRLLELQQKDGGWGWQGSGATHEMMTPYALYGLIEAQKAGFTIPNEKAIERGMVRLEQFIDNMGTRQAADRIYCMWVYSQQKPLKDNWWKWLHQLSNKTLTTKKVRNDLLSDYAAALTLEMATKSKWAHQKSLADQMMRLLSYRAKLNQSKTQAHWTTSGFSRWGNDKFEITAAVLKAVVAHDSEHPLVAQSLNYFAATKRGNRWNSTKDTAMILYAMCDYLTKQNIKLDDSTTETKLTINGKEHVITNPSWKPKKMIISGKELVGKNLQVEFTKGDKSHQYRMVFRYWKQGKDVAAVNKGINLSRTLELIDTTGKRIRLLKSADTVPSGSFIRSTVHASFNKRADFTLLVDPKISAAEFTSIQRNNAQPSLPYHVPYVLKEDKAVGTFWHYELAQSGMTNTSIYRVEMEGSFLIAPAYAELMYDTAVRGNSDSFMLIVKEK